ncbi:MAG: twin-arginine translocase TatA/TatE family subunit [Gemmataceae bacterium]
MFGLGTQEFLLLVVLGVLLFGKNLPEVGRSLGKMIMEFKNGLRGVEGEFRSTFFDFDQPPQSRSAPPTPVKRLEPTAPKFEDPSGPVC